MFWYEINPIKDKEIKSEFAMNFEGQDRITSVRSSLMHPSLKTGAENDKRKLICDMQKQLDLVSDLADHQGENTHTHTRCLWACGCSFQVNSMPCVYNPSMVSGREWLFWALVYLVPVMTCSIHEWLLPRMHVHTCFWFIFSMALRYQDAEAVQVVCHGKWWNGHRR